MRTFIRTNFRIRVPEVRVIGADGSQVGVMPTLQARQLAERQGLDLVEISPSAVPPVCRIMDFGRYKYDEEKKSKETKKSQVAGKLKEIKFHANVEDHDYHTKIRHARDFIAEGHRVKCTLYFRGRENAHQELGFEVMKRVMRDCEDIASPEQVPNLMGKMLQMMLGPKRGRVPQPARPPAPAGGPGGPAPQAAPRPVPSGSPVAPAPGPRPVPPAPALRPTLAPGAPVPGNTVLK